jgi:DNA repair protein RadA/Sms
MARAAGTFICSVCEAEALQWAGRCPTCGEWNSLIPSESTRRGAPALRVARPLSSISSAEQPDPLSTGNSELDRVLGGGLVAGSVTLLFGPPGIGKSTLLFQVLSAVSAQGHDVVLASAEESLGQVLGRARRLGPVPDRLLAIESHDVMDVVASLEHCRPDLVVVDSIQSVADPTLPQPTGSVAQVRSCVETMTRWAKASGVPVVLVGHVTKDGDLAGPRVVEHLVDTVLSFDGDRHHALRVLTAVKHRFGSAGEVGLFSMGDDGLRPVPDPGPLLLGDRVAGVAGSVVVPVLQGRRPLLVELQALLADGSIESRPRAQGLDASRAAMLLAVLKCRAHLPIERAEIYVAAVGGITVAEPAADLALALCLASAALGQPIPHDAVVVGEVGLAGEVRAVPSCDRRLAEALRAGFTHAVVPASTPPQAVPEGLEVLRVRMLQEALAWAVGPEVPGTMPTWLTETANR